MQIIFFVSMVVIFSYTQSIGTSALKSRYKYPLIFSFLLLLFGCILDYFNFENKPFLFHTTLSSISIFSIIYYEILRIILRPFIGKYPYVPFRNKLGSKVIGKGYPKNRRVKLFDYIFGFLMSLLPLITIILISYYIKA